MNPIISIENLLFSWPKGPPLLEIAQFQLARGERLLVQGQSGIGKTSLLSLISGIIRPQADSFKVLGENFLRLPAISRDRLRGERMGVIFQQFNLLPYLSVLQNVLLPTQLFPDREKRCTARDASAQDQATRLLDALGLPASVWHQPSYQLSVGQQQRVAAARALIGAPDLILADEPTSALDEDHQQEFMRLLMEQVRLTGAACILVSHQRSLNQFFDRVTDLTAINQVKRKAA
ncbi:MAG: ATP-binding cassette domain-containing protein [Betaproteobacteria bacterium]|jgi:putative ABC transport system ATP-binding protein|nr:ATP-binding cassette domain-containing protein [Betaproteobacteria bacterium]